MPPLQVRTGQSPTPEPARRRVAVVGSGIAGLSAAWLLAGRHDVILWEADRRLGGHSNTVEVETPRGSQPVDTGFIVFNDRNYPNLTALFDHLGVATEASDMSFSVSIGAGRLEYAGGTGGLGLFAQPSNLVKLRFWRLVGDIRRFFREQSASAPGDHRGLTVADMLAKGGYGAAFVRAHLLPMAAAIWSGSVRDILAFPADSFIAFFRNHGLLQIADRPQWRTVSGGSRRYVDKLAERLAGRIRLGAPVDGIARQSGGVRLRAGGESHVYDEVVIAAHADQALRMLDDPSLDESRLLGGFGYAPNRAYLHGDERLMPRRRRAWASWNYLANTDVDLAAPVSVTYWMNRLQNLRDAPPIFVSLNPDREPDRIHDVFDYEHPQFDQAAMASQRKLAQIQGGRHTWFCGSYFGYGFHEDALSSAIEVAAALGASAPWATPLGETRTATFRTRQRRRVAA